MRLVPFEEQHFSLLAGWFDSEAAVVQWGGPEVSFPLDASQLQAMLAAERSTPSTRLCRMSVAGDDVVGHGQLALDWRHGNVTLGRVAIAPGQRGRGLAVRMVELLVGAAFAFPEVERVQLGVYAFNGPAIRIYERLGFVREGVRRRAVRVGADRWDSVVMALLRDEWRPPAKGERTGSF